MWLRAGVSSDCGRTCMQVVETKIREVMHSRPRTCSSDIKAVDAMLVSTFTAGTPLMLWPIFSQNSGGLEI